MEDWLKWAMELQSIGQIGITYAQDKHDIERFERIREISAEIVSKYTDIKVEKVKNLFCNETGYQTPKVETRAAIFEDNKILLVKEKKEQKWALPGGWMDINLTIRENTIKEVQEEAGLDVETERLIAILEHNKNNPNIFPYGICKVFVLCKKISGEFKDNLETEDSGFFSFQNLPDLIISKNTLKQIEMCFAACNDPNWKVVFD